MTVTSTLKRAVSSGAILAVAIAVVGGIVGGLVDGGRGVASALIGAAIAFVFLALTAGTIVIGNRVTAGDLLNPRFILVVFGGWVLKFVIFIVALVLLRDQAFINDIVLFLTIVVAVIGTLVVDMVVVTRSRLPYVGKAD